MIIEPPINLQGRKTKLVNWIRECSSEIKFDRWVEPFMGSGIVAFNIRPKSALLCDNNPHIITFYKAIQSKKITSNIVNKFLKEEGNKLIKSNGEHFYTVKERFGANGNPLDFLFLNRTCFNGIIRFNKSGGCNMSFCHKPNRFSPSLIANITIKVDKISEIIEMGNYEFKYQDFKDTLSEINSGDLTYCDPPYIGRYVQYFSSWSETEEIELNNLLGELKSPFIMSTWLKDQDMVNDYIFSLCGDCSIITKEHTYIIGGIKNSRKSVSEALLTNFPTPNSVKVSQLNMETETPYQLVFS